MLNCSKKDTLLLLPKCIYSLKLACSLLLFFFLQQFHLTNFLCSFPCTFEVHTMILLYCSTCLFLPLVILRALSISYQTWLHKCCNTETAWTVAGVVLSPCSSQQIGHKSLTHALSARTENFKAVYNLSSCMIIPILHELVRLHSEYYLHSFHQNVDS
jgi:hypothetical protein